MSNYVFPCLFCNVSASPLVLVTVKEGGLSHASSYPGTCTFTVISYRCSSCVVVRDTPSATKKKQTKKTRKQEKGTFYQNHFTLQTCATFFQSQLLPDSLVHSNLFLVICSVCSHTALELGSTWTYCNISRLVKCKSQVHSKAC